VDVVVVGGSVVDVVVVVGGTVVDGDVVVGGTVVDVVVVGGTVVDVDVVVGGTVVEVVDVVLDVVVGGGSKVMLGVVVVVVLVELVVLVVVVLVEVVVLVDVVVLLEVVAGTATLTETGTPVSLVWFGSGTLWLMSAVSVVVRVAPGVADALTATPTCTGLEPAASAVIVQLTAPAPVMLQPGPVTPVNVTSGGGAMPKVAKGVSDADGLTRFTVSVPEPPGGTLGTLGSTTERSVNVPSPR
jgi:hypothetical protein